ncbi:WYL domain-containing protein [Meridianimarinicoccus roseus]|uniref:WYL domain-containing protein n=1 Tax=Meridianimarinicoccus roseus TaxID=2072018 RepID=A0A2V2LLH2_9RHOB|nr:WYL domain-containing protein [Meridianimarinicoccus roseus]PWR03149.1 WYL domain-containing protein [Meridianimarinicoccus roseus]
MSYAKASNLLRLADMASARYDGVTLGDVQSEFDCDHRTAQRMMRALEDLFPNVDILEGEDRRRRWKLARSDPRWLQAQGLGDSELAAIDLAARRAERDGAPDEARRLRALRDRLLAAMPRAHARRTEADAEALLEAQGFASRPGPRVVADLRLLGTLTEALRAPWELDIGYRGALDAEPQRRLVEPHGMLLGIRRYLVARPSGGDGRMRRFRLDRIEGAAITQRSFARDPDFDLKVFAARAFGSYHADEEYGPVEWRFSPDAAPTARRFLFHPDQEMTDMPDGGLTVRFAASGHLEMAWHLYQWGDSVEVICPPALRALVARHQRGDFPALP